MNTNDQSTITGNCISADFLYPARALTPSNGFSVEPVDGGYIVSGTFPAVGYRRCVASSVPALVKLLRVWTGQPKKKDA
jgi:hypothetical protein